MKVRHSLILLAALAHMLLTSTAQAVIITHVNVDTHTGGGPAIASLDPSNPQFYDSNTGIKTFSFIATNNGAEPLADVRFLLQFFSDESNTPLVFNDASDTWTLAPRSISWVSSPILLQGAGGFLMSETDAPINFPPYGSLAATDTVPQVLIGDIPAFGSLPFTIQANLSSNFVFDGVGSLVALPGPVPEPSTLALMALCAAGLVVARRRYRKV